ncbi:MAG TPA: MarR family transcriptional regulator [Gaiellaceae bacterium]|nr:MarR family transcriptional regulator [Gaiellaceae bacterium]
MIAPASSSDFTESAGAEAPAGPPLIGALLRIPWEAVRHRMLERLHERGFEDFEPAHLNVFQYPGPNGARPSDLAAQLGMSKQALNYLLGELERLGYLERRADQTDRRSKRIALTRRGGSVVQTIREVVEEVERDWAQQVGPARFDELRTLLVELNRLVRGEHA